ncbi:unnamed protein product [Macrosiphum euphorbiae]|uniref:DUF4806 domain-containing protein n=1 Tax=Macrosiphum euphorbiae TaxID=13131 RepID=A0AAV0WPW5_9HEMI|nr:unnamed protein product [Macrosiphum euphorbiae]
MFKSKRSKSRNIRQELDFINNLYSNENNTLPTNNHGTVEINACTGKDIQFDKIINLPSTSTRKNNNNISPHLANSTPCAQETITSASQLDNEENEENNLYSFTNASDINNSFKEKLGIWAVECNVPKTTVNKLLKLLKRQDNINTQDLPNDCRTLLVTPKSTERFIRTVTPGSYYHFGLAEGIRRYAISSLTDIKIAIGIDGLPLAKSNNSQFWPIMAYIVGMDKNVFPVGIYFGKSKPKDSNDFLLDFVAETKDLITNGIEINGCIIKVIIYSFVCDAPARSFLLKTKGHSGYSSCNRCIAEGEYYQNRICFPYSDSKSTKRTHETYENMTYEEHHVAESISNLVELPGIDLVHTFALDYMHLVCLGVVKKLIMLWLHKGPLNVRIPSRNVHKLTEALLAVKCYIPSDFVRKTREIQEISRWKATELRLFLLYVGPIVLKNIINDDFYNHFMSLNISMIILLSPNLHNYVPYAEELLDYFIKTFEILYGREHNSHNIHGLSHLCDDFKYYGPLDNCSAFPFENYMKELKSKIRKHEKPLEQVINRYSEIYSQKSFIGSFKNTTNHPILLLPHNNGPLINNVNGCQYKKMILKNITINTKFDKDSYVLTTDGEVFKCLNIVQQNNETVLIGKHFTTKKLFYEKPTDSTEFDIYIVENLSQRLKSYTINNVKKKIMLIMHNRNSIAMPIIHT